MKLIFFKISHKKNLIIPFLIFIIFNLHPNYIYSWGFFAHQKINKYAVFSLPEEMLKFYKKHINYLEENSVNPDKRRYTIEGEACKHYIDIESYEKISKTIPKLYISASKKYNKNFLKEHGKLPWIIEQEKNKLIQALKNKDYIKILKISADIGHYIADANVPLHTSANYDSQLTNQKGIHAFWETRIPKLFFDRYDLLVGHADFIENTLEYIWDAIYRSHSLVKNLLKVDKELTESFSSYNKYTFEIKNNVTHKVISKEYCEKYNILTKNQVEKQFKKSIKMVSDFWYTCWIKAGKPILDSSISFSLKNTYRKEAKKSLKNIRIHE